MEDTIPACGRQLDWETDPSLYTPEYAEIDGAIARLIGLGPEQQQPEAVRNAVPGSIFRIRYRKGWDQAKTLTTQERLTLVAINAKEYEIAQDGLEGRGHKTHGAVFYEPWEYGYPNNEWHWSVIDTLVKFQLVATRRFVGKSSIGYRTNWACRTTQHGEWVAFLIISEMKNRMDDRFDPALFSLDEEE